MTIEMIVALIGASVVAYAIVNRLRLMAPVLLIAAGVGVALLPVGEEMHLPSIVVLTIFLPILLYWEPLSVSLNRMRRSLRGIILSAIIYIAMVVGRFAGYHLMIYAIRIFDRRPEQRLRRTNIRGRIVSTVAGFRGAISLAMALSVPVSFDGAAYAERNLIILIVASVTLLSLIIQGIPLPHVVRWANARPSTAEQSGESVELQEIDALADIVEDTINQLMSLLKVQVSTTTQPSRRCAPTTHVVTAP